MNMVSRILATAILSQTAAFGHPAEAQSPTENSEAPASDRQVGKTLHLCAIIHNEEDVNGRGPTGRADFDGDRDVLAFTTDQYRKIGKLFQKYGAKINLQCDWTFTDGVRKFDPEFFAGWEAMGHETDAHAHESHVSYSEVKRRLKAAGASPTRVIGGTLEDGVQQRLARFEAVWPEFEVLWGVATMLHRRPEEKTGYVWRPAKNGSWFNHDPKGKIIYVGGTGSPMQVETIREAYAKASLDKVNTYSIFLGSFEGPERFECRLGLASFEEFLKEIQELQKTCDVQWKSLTEVAEIFKARETEGSLDFSDIDVNAIPRDSPGIAIPGRPRKRPIRKGAPGREADYNNDGTVDDFEMRLWRKAGPIKNRAAPAVANAFVAFTRLVKRGLTSIIYVTPLTQYAVRQVRDGRRVGCRMNNRDVLSEYAQRSKRFTVEPTWWTWVRTRTTHAAQARRNAHVCRSGRWRASRAGGRARPAPPCGGQAAQARAASPSAGRAARGGSGLSATEKCRGGFGGKPSCAFVVSVVDGAESAGADPDHSRRMGQGRAYVTDLRRGAMHTNTAVATVLALVVLVWWGPIPACGQPAPSDRPDWRAGRLPRIELPPDPSRIRILPEKSGWARITGASGAAADRQARMVVIVNLATADRVAALIGPDGSFEARLFAPPGSSLQISTDTRRVEELSPQLREAMRRNGWITPSDVPGGEPFDEFVGTHTSSSPGTIVEVLKERGTAQKTSSFAKKVGPDLWLFGSSRSSATQVDPDDVVDLEITLTVAFGPKAEDRSTPRRPPTFGPGLHRLFDKDGRQRSPGRLPVSNVLTPTGLPIETHGEIVVEGQPDGRKEWNLGGTGLPVPWHFDDPGTWRIEHGQPTITQRLKFEIPDHAPAGLYQLHSAILGVGEEEYDAGEPAGGPCRLCYLRVGDPAPPRLSCLLLGSCASRFLDPAGPL